jgi:hypothetical protein
MITKGLLAIFAQILDWAYSLLPDWDMSKIYGPAQHWEIYDGKNHYGESSPLQAIIWWMHYYNDFIPFDQFLLIINLGFVLMSAILGYKLVKWIVGVIRGAGTS